MNLGDLTSLVEKPFAAVSNLVNTLLPGIRIGNRFRGGPSR